MEYVDPDAFGRPAHEAIVKGLARAVDGGRIDPAPAGLQHMDDAADHAAVIDARFAACVVGKMGASRSNWLSLSQNWSLIRLLPQLAER